MLKNLDRIRRSGGVRPVRRLAQVGSLLMAGTVLAVAGCTSPSGTSSTGAPAATASGTAATASGTAAANSTAALTADQFKKLLAQSTPAGFTITAAFAPRPTSAALPAACVAFGESALASSYTSSGAQHGGKTFNVALNLLKTTSTDFTTAFIAACSGSASGLTSTTGTSGGVVWAVHSAENSSILLEEYRGVGLAVIPPTGGVSISADDFTKDFAASVDAAAA